MISENFSIDEFVEAVKDKDIWEVLNLAVDEITWADRINYHLHHRSGKQLLGGQHYSHELKQLINYLRYEVKPRRPHNKAYRLYVANWGAFDQEQRDLLTDRPASAVQ